MASVEIAGPALVGVQNMRCRTRRTFSPLTPWRRRLSSCHPMRTIGPAKEGENIVADESQEEALPRARAAQPPAGNQDDEVQNEDLEQDDATEGSEEAAPVSVAEACCETNDAASRAKCTLCPRPICRACGR